MAYNDGLPDNIHFFEVVQGIQDQKKCKKVRTGPDIAKNVGELNQRSQKYFNDHESVRQFPPTYYLKGDTTKTFVDKVDGLKWLSKAPIKILTNYNPVDHLRLLGLTDKDRNKIMSRTYEAYDNVVLVVHPEEKWLVVNVIVDGVPDPKTLQLEMEKMNDILKTIYKTGYQKIKEHYMTLIGLIICPHLDEKDLNSNIFPFLDDSKPMSTFVTKKEWNDVEVLEDKFESLVIESKRNIKSCQNESGAIKRNSTGDIEMYTGQLMASMAQRSLFLPKVTDNLEEKIDTILLNDDQIKAINDPSKWKIINGGFGSGKTVVLNEIARQMIKQDDIGAICYLPFAPYSLIDKKFEESFHLLCKKEEEIEHLSFKLKSISLQQCLKEMHLALSDVYDLTSPPSKNVSLIMEHLKTKYCTDGKKIVILIDEFPREFINKDYACDLTDSLENHFEDITVVISFQSVEKAKEVESYGRILRFSDGSIYITGMKDFKLGKIMRIARNNYQLNKILEDEIAQSKHIIPLKYEATREPIKPPSLIVRLFSSLKNKRKKTQNQDPKQKTKDKDSFDDFEKNRPYSDKNDGAGNFEEPNSELTDPTLSSKKRLDTSRLHDPEIILKDLPREPKDKLVLSISTKISFIESKCGISFCSPTKPKLHLFSSSLTSYQSIVCLSVVLGNCIRDAEKVVIICTSKDQVETMKMALDRIDLKKPYHIYIPYLLGPLPESQQKSEIIKASNLTNFILVTDYRSFRGCEAEKCIMVIDLNELIGPNIFVEILTRAVAYIDILVTPRNKSNAASNTSKKVMSKVLSEWREKQLVSEVFVELQADRTRNINQIDVKITESGVTKTLSREIKHGEEEAFKKRMELSDVDDHTDALQ